MPDASPNLAATAPERLVWLEWLRRDGIALSESAEAVPLAGGVSSEIYLVRDGSRAFVVKRALEKLKVVDDWRSDPVRNRHEQRYLRFVGSFLPQAVPEILSGDEERGYFAMEYFGEGFTNWKDALLRGECDPQRARDAMTLLATVHAESRDRPDLAADFDTTANFHELRTDPYLLTTARRHPALSPFFEEEAARLERTRECLVHGDFSPKNILFGPGRMVLLDCEVAWYGDPAFDVAFLLNHLCLKALHHAPRRQDELRAVFDAAVEAYFKPSLQGAGEAAVLDCRSARLLLMLMLARIDGKSPAEYLCDEQKKNFVREFVSDLLPDFRFSVREVGARWFARLEQRFHQQ